MKIAILTGGNSIERDISLAAGEASYKAIQSLGYEVVKIDADESLPLILQKERPDVAFIALHGTMVEDGVLQGVLEWMKIPYTHSGVLASALAMNKHKCKDVLREAGLPVAPSVVARREEIAASHLLEPPYVVKPVNEGSSLGGIFYVERVEDAPLSIDSLDRDVYMVEKYAQGRELTASIMGDKKLAVSEFVLSGKLHDFDSKYVKFTDNQIIPAPLPKDIYDYVLDLALKTHQALGCRGVSRTDFRWDESQGQDGLIILEINTQPGFRPNAYIGLQAQHVGISFEDMCDWMIKDASLNR